MLQVNLQDSSSEESYLGDAPYSLRRHRIFNSSPLKKHIVFKARIGIA